MQKHAQQHGIAVRSLSHVWLFATPRTTARQASLSFPTPWSLLRFMSIESVMSSNHLILCCPLLLLPSIFPSIRVFSNESALPSGGQNTGASTLISVLPINIQSWFPLGLTGLKRLSVAKASWMSRLERATRSSRKSPHSMTKCPPPNSSHMAALTCLQPGHSNTPGGRASPVWQLPILSLKCFPVNLPPLG